MGNYYQYGWNKWKHKNCIVNIWIAKNSNNNIIQSFPIRSQVSIPTHTMSPVTELFLMKLFNCISAGDQLADMFTKPLPDPKFLWYRDDMGYPQFLWKRDDLGWIYNAALELDGWDVQLTAHPVGVLESGGWCLVDGVHGYLHPVEGGDSLVTPRRRVGNSE